MEFSGYGKPVVQDIDLRVREIPLFKVGPLRSVLCGWLDEGFFPMGTMNLASEVWDHLGNYLFYFSVPVKNQLSLRLGTLKREVRIRTWPTVVLLVVIFFVLRVLWHIFCIRVPEPRKHGNTFRMCYKSSNLGNA